MQMAFMDVLQQLQQLLHHRQSPVYVQQPRFSVFLVSERTSSHWRSCCDTNILKNGSKMHSVFISQMIYQEIRSDFLSDFFTTIGKTLVLAPPLSPQRTLIGQVILRSAEKCCKLLHFKMDLREFGPEIPTKQLPYNIKMHTLHSFN